MKFQTETHKPECGADAAKRILLLARVLISGPSLLSFFFFLLPIFTVLKTRNLSPNGYGPLAKCYFTRRTNDGFHWISFAINIHLDNMPLIRENQGGKKKCFDCFDINSTLILLTLSFCFKKDSKFSTIKKKKILKINLRWNWLINETKHCYSKYPRNPTKLQN